MVFERALELDARGKEPCEIILVNGEDVVGTQVTEIAALIHLKVYICYDCLCSYRIAGLSRSS